MSNLRTVEKRYFEDLFGMATGYVLDFSNNSFAEFFREAADIEIYTEKYEINGGSKANRLRTFWETEPNSVVGKILAELLEIWVYENEDKASRNTKYDKCREIVARLSGSTTASADGETDFLKQNIDLPGLDQLQLDQAVTRILESRLKEIEIGLKMKAPMSVIFLCGSLLEGALLGTARKTPEVFNRSSCSPKRRDGKVKPLHEWTLAQFIDVSCDIDIIQLDVKKFSHALRDFRNYIHPYQQLVSGFSPDQHTAEICFQVLKAALAGLSKER